MFAGTLNFTALVGLRLAGNALSDRETFHFCAELKKNEYAPKLQYEEIDDDHPTEFAACKGGEGRLRQCLRSLADGETINPLVCKNEIWLTRSSTTAKLCAQPITPSPEDLI